MSFLKVLTSVCLRGALDSLVVAIINIIANPSVIINKLLSRPEPIATPYDPFAAAYITIAISGKVVAILNKTLPTNLAPYFSERCSAPYESIQLAIVTSPNHTSIPKRLFSAIFMKNNREKMLIYYL